MFQSHLDEQPLMTSPSNLGQEPAAVDAGSRDAVIPQPADMLTKYKPMITIALIALAAFMLLKAMKAKKIAPKITG